MAGKAVDSGAFKKWMLILLAIVAFIASLYLESTVTAYNVKNILRRACIEKIRQEKGNPEQKSNWEKAMQAELNGEKVPLTDDQWSLEVKQITQGRRPDFDCRARAVFDLETDWFLVSDIMELFGHRPKPLKTRHKIDFVVHYRGDY